MTFTSQFVINELPETPHYLLLPNMSNDITTDGISLTSFPEDSMPDGEYRGRLTGPEAIDFLWRDGRVPQWINVSIVAVENGVTLFELYCCGRYVADEKDMYYNSGNMGPFGLKSPVLPPGWKDKDPKFDLHWRRNYRAKASEGN